jgi:hypothetical protein
MMPDFKHLLDLLEAKGWFLYEGVAGADLGRVIERGRTREMRPGPFYHLMPAISHDTSPEEMRAAAAEAARRKAMPMFDDGVNRGPVLGIHIQDGDFAFVSNPNSFVFGAEKRTSIEEAIKFNLSSHNTYFFSSIDEVGTFHEEQGIAPQLPAVLPSQLRWTYVHRDEDPTWIAIWPESPGEVLFRGQSRRYIPCVSTSVRGLGIEARFLHELSAAKQASLIVKLIRTEWFVTILREMTAVKWLKDSRVFLDEMAVAQHYGLPTGYIDLTQSFDVASFFACCRFDHAAKIWAPVAEGEGVIYALFRHAVPAAYAIRPINLQPFPRPSEQWGWTCELRLGDDFDRFPFVHKFIFRHDLQASRRILAKFSNGAALFPTDPLSELADAINASPVLPVGVAQRIARDLIDDPQGKPGATVVELLSLVGEEPGVELSDNATIHELPRIRLEMDNVWERKRGDFFDGIGFHSVRNEPRRLG